MELFSLEALFTLLMLIFLQAVLGFDNLLYISLESKRVAEADQPFVRRLGIGLAIILRLVLLVVVVQAIAMFQDPIWFLVAHIEGFITYEFNVHSLIVLLGGVFIIYTAFKEIMHMLSVHEVGHDSDQPKRKTWVSIAWIVVMNLVFSFDSILSAIALTGIDGAAKAGHVPGEVIEANHTGSPIWSAEFVVMAIAIVTSGVLMIVMADQVSEFLKRNRLYEVLGLFILLIVGIMLTSEGGHLAHLSFFGYPIDAMSKTTFYFSIAIMVVVDVAQGRYQKKLDRERAHHT